MLKQWICLGKSQHRHLSKHQNTCQFQSASGFGLWRSFLKPVPGSWTPDCCRQIWRFEHSCVASRVFCGFLVILWIACFAYFGAWDSMADSRFTASSLFRCSSWKASQQTWEQSTQRRTRWGRCGCALADWTSMCVHTCTSHTILIHVHTFIHTELLTYLLTYLPTYLLYLLA